LEYTRNIPAGKERTLPVKKPLAVIIMGAAVDAPHCARIEAALSGFGIEVESRVASAHKTPAHLLSLLAAYEKEGRPRVYITVAGLSNALSGFVDGAVDAPVISCPPPSQDFGGADIFSSIRLPPGIGPGFVLDPANAALLAAKILGLVEPAVAARAAALRAANAAKTIAEDSRGA
jgi:5-(carboxyamino)imidazole ribonucleotide mutase/phosphoribosylaminoimidazole-succinocarboxamide synthase